MTVARKPCPAEIALSDTRSKLHRLATIIREADDRHGDLDERSQIVVSFLLTAAEREATTILAEIDESLAEAAR